MAKEKVPWGTIAIIGILGIGAYLIYKMVKPFSEASGAVSGAVGGAWDVGNTPVAPTTPGGVVAPTPFEIAFPPLAIPKFIDTFGKTPKGDISPLVAPIKATIDVGTTLGVFQPKVGTTQLTKPEVQQAIKQMDLSYKKFYPTPKINPIATTTRAAMLTSFNKLQTPSVQIQAYSTGKKVIKVGGISKKVM